jgi:exodeoxyribonuclease VII small subunit
VSGSDTNTKPELSFEEALKRLEEIVAKMDDPNVTIEDSVRYYEEGLALSKQCSATLESATLRIEEIHQSMNPGTAELTEED